MHRGGRPVAPSVMAHRGGAALGPENDPATLAAAAAAGATSVEVDLVQTADGALVMLHDATVTVGGARHWVRDLRLDEVVTATGGPPGTHRDLLAACAELGIGCYAEVKAAGTQALDVFVDDVVAAGLEELVCVASFRADVVAHVARRGELDTSWLFHDPGTDPRAMAEDLGCTFVHPCFDLFPHMVDLMAGPWTDRLWAAGLGVVSWSTVDPVLMARLADAGVAALCTDDPRTVPAALRPPAT